MLDPGVWGTGTIWGIPRGWPGASQCCGFLVWLHRWARSWGGSPELGAAPRVAGNRTRSCCTGIKPVPGSAPSLLCLLPSSIHISTTSTISISSSLSSFHFYPFFISILIPSLSLHPPPSSISLPSSPSHPTQDHSGGHQKWSQRGVKPALPAFQYPDECSAPNQHPQNPGIIPVWGWEEPVPAGKHLGSFEPCCDDSLLFNGSL